MSDSLPERLDRVIIQLDGAAEAAADEGHHELARALRGMLSVTRRLSERKEVADAE